MSFNKRLTQLRNSKNLTKKELALKLNLAPSSISMYESGNRKPSFEVIEALADFFNVDLDYLLAKTNYTTRVEHIPNITSIEDTPKGFKVPVLGEVAAGTPIEAVEDIIDYEELPIAWKSKGEFFGLQIKGNSMQPKMDEGDVVIVKQQSDAETGDTIIAIVNGDNATCKKLKKTDNGLMLISTNPEYEPMFYTWQEVKEKPVTIIGKVVELRAKF